MRTVPLDLGLLRELFTRRDALVRAIQTGATSGQWEPVLPAFDDLLATIALMEDAARTAAEATGRG